MPEHKDVFEELIKALEKQDKGKNSVLDSSEFRSLLALSRLESTMQVRFIADQMPGGFFIYRADGGEELIYCNKALIRLFGCDDLEDFKAHTGYSFAGIVHPDDIEEVERSIEEQIEESQYDLDYVEYRIIQKDGTVRWVEDYGHYVNTEDGGLFYVFVADATEKRRQQMAEKAEALQAVNEELTRRLKMIEGFSIGYESIFYADLDTDTLQPYQLSNRGESIVSPDSRDSFEKAIGRYIERWVHPDDRETMRRDADAENIRERLEHDRAFHVTYRVMEDSGVSYLQMLAYNVGGRERVSQIVIGFRSVDDEIRRQMEQRQLMENALKRATAAMEAKSTFLSNMSHDLLTPMNAVLGYTALAKKATDNPDKLRAYLDNIDDAGNRMLELIKGVLELSRVQDSALESDESPCDIREMTAEVERLIRPMADDREIKFDVDTEHLEHFSVITHEEKLSQVLVKLLTNAVNFTGRGGRVRLTVSESGAPTRDYAVYRFCVEDNGPGIDPEYLSRIFEPFERRQSSTISGVPGMGLGLTIARSIVELMGGSLSAESEVGRGSRFTVSLSLRVVDGGKRSAKGEISASSGACRVLLTEDNEINRELGVEVLKSAGFEVETAENGKIALEKVIAAEPGYYTLILMDIQMPVMDGNAAARAIRALPDRERADVPIIALSANSLEEDRKRSTESGMNGHIAKPIQPSELFELMEKII